MGALDDAVSILGCFSIDEPSLAQAELVRRTGRPKATISRVMKTLRTSGLLEFDAATRLYTPGVRLFELGQICRSNSNFLDLVQSRLQKVCDVGGHTGYITVFDGAETVVLRIIRGSSPLAIASSAGYRAPPHGTSNGRAMLALMSDEEIRRRLPDPLPHASAKSPQTFEALLAAVSRIRETGRSMSSSEAYEGISSEGIALRDPESREIIGIAISFPSASGTPDLRETIHGLLQEMKTELLRHR